MTRKSVQIRVSAPETDAHAHAGVDGTRDAWVAAGTSPVEPVVPGGFALELAGPQRPDATRTSDAEIASLLFPGLAAAECGLTLFNGADAIGRTFADAMAGCARRSVDGAVRLMQCLTPQDAAVLHGQLAHASLAEALKLVADVARISERAATKAAAGVSRL
jgi:hypothetical protein